MPESVHTPSLDIKRLWPPRKRAQPILNLLRLERRHVDHFEIIVKDPKAASRIPAVLHDARRLDPRSDGGMMLGVLFDKVGYAVYEVWRVGIGVPVCVYEGVVVHALKGVLGHGGKHGRVCVHAHYTCQHERCLGALRRREGRV